MLLRFRWFTLGALSTIGVGAYLAARVRKARERFTVGAFGRAGAHGVAAALDLVADRIAPRT
jgi:hypothetical protein